MFKFILPNPVPAPYPLYAWESCADNTHPICPLPPPHPPCSALYAGESYEVCLTTALARRGAPPPHALYASLRAINPAPYAAWLHFGPSGVC